MQGNSFNYYGYDRDTYLDCMGMIHATNRKHVFILTTWFLVVNLLYLVFSSLNLFGVTQERVPFYAAYLALTAAFEAALIFAPRFSERRSAAPVYASMALMLSYGVLTSIAQPYMPATMYLLMLALCALSYTDRMYRMTGAMLLASGAFLLTSYLFKTFSIAYHDTYNACIVLTLAVGLHYTFQRTRVQQFILYQKDLHIQRELEVKSSFDALTSLLNRGRFFSIAEEVMRQESEGEYLALCLLDLDGFKEINDQMGHQMGDKAIQIAGRTILETLGIDLSEKWSFPERALRNRLSFAGRLGGDEFIALVRGRRSTEEVMLVLQNMLDTLNGVRLDGLDGIHASFGVTELHTGQGGDIDNAYKRADDALYESKRAGKNQIRFHGRQ